MPIPFARKTAGLRQAGNEADERGGTDGRTNEAGQDERGGTDETFTVKDSTLSLVVRA
jgi:hypothetical protein